MEALDIVETADESPSTSKLNASVAITVALLATFMGICKVKDDNICQAMQQSQANKVDHWSSYQARNVREEVAKSTVAQLKLAALDKPASQQAAYQQAIAQYEALTRQWALYITALVPTFFGVLMGLSGLLGWSIHPNGLIALLS